MARQGQQPLYRPGKYLVDLGPVLTPMEIAGQPLKMGVGESYPTPLTPSEIDYTTFRIGRYSDVKQEPAEKYTRDDII